MSNRRPPPRVIILLGPQGSGKGTQAALLGRRLRLVAISSGSLYREAAAKKTRLGQLAARCIRRGLLLPDQITNSLVMRRLREPDARRGVILDGYPRTLGQMAAFSRLVQPEKVVVIAVPDAVARARISGRRVCLSCGRNFHLSWRPPLRRGVCDSCGGKLGRRVDDEPAAIRRRFAIYHRETEPVFAAYKKLGLLVKINGARPVATVARDVWRAVRRK